MDGFDSHIDSTGFNEGIVTQPTLANDPAITYGTTPSIKAMGITTLGQGGQLARSQGTDLGLNNHNEAQFPTNLGLQSNTEEFRLVSEQYRKSQGFQYYTNQGQSVSGYTSGLNEQYTTGISTKQEILPQLPNSFQWYASTNSQYTYKTLDPKNDPTSIEHFSDYKLPYDTAMNSTQANYNLQYATDYVNKLNKDTNQTLGGMFQYKLAFDAYVGNYVIQKGVTANYAQPWSKFGEWMKSYLDYAKDIVNKEQKGITFANPDKSLEQIQDTVNRIQYLLTAMPEWTGYHEGDWWSKSAWDIAQKGVEQSQREFAYRVMTQANYKDLKFQGYKDYEHYFGTNPAKIQPTWYDYMYDIAEFAKQLGISYASSGYTNWADLITKGISVGSGAKVQRSTSGYQTEYGSQIGNIVQGITTLNNTIEGISKKGFSYIFNPGGE